MVSQLLSDRLRQESQLQAIQQNQEQVMAALQSLHSAQQQNSARAAFSEDALGQTIDEVRHLKSPHRAQLAPGKPQREATCRGQPHA